MKMKSVVLLAVALGCGLVAMLGVQQVLKRDQPKPDEVGKVLVAIADISPGQPLDETNTKFEEKRIDAIPEGAVTREDQVEERAARYATVMGEVIMIAKLTDKGNFRPTAEIPDGMRVATVPVDQTATHSGLIRPGDHVDVVVTYSDRTQGREVKRAKTILQYIEVWATDAVRMAGGAAEEGGELSVKNISLLVSPPQYSLLQLANMKGDITLALRSNTDDTIVESSPIDDAMFDEMATGIGESGENPLLARDRVFEEGQASPETGDVREFLNKQQGEPVAEPVAEKWTITIYEGETVRVAEVELPENAEEHKTDADATSAPEGILNLIPGGTKADGPSASSSVQGWMKTIFAGK